MITRIVQFLLTALFALIATAPTYAADINREWVDFTPSSEIRWVKNPNGNNEQAILLGHPSKPGPYVARYKWYAGKMSRPHFHNSDRTFVVISGTWWMGTGDKFDPDSTVPATAGSYVIHRANGIHYDGAKDEETIIQVWGIGPVTSTPAEKK
ncbi:MAG: cupin domain-containing protein [Burkholderiales bacterium]